MTEPQRVLDQFLDALERQGSAIASNYQMSEEWTVLATNALVDTATVLAPLGRAVAKGYQDDWGRSEYLGLDVVVLPKSGWGAPLLAAEHENSPYLDRIQYNAWKLVSVIADIRILVAYWIGSDAQLLAKVGEVVKDQHRPIIVITADYRAAPRAMPALRALYTARVVSA